MQHKTTSILLAGVGGQGSLLASAITSQAALNAGFQTKTNEVHGMAQRGGSVVTQIRYGREVFSPLIPAGAAQAIGAFEMMEALRYAQFLAPGGMAVISTHRIIPVSVSSGAAKYPDDLAERLRRVFPKLVLVDAEGLAAEIGSRRVSNAVVLGALSRGLELPEAAWQSAFETVVKPGFLKINLRAFTAGRELASG